MSDALLNTLIGFSCGFAGAWAYFKFAGLLRTRGEYRLALHFTDEEIDHACQRQANELETR